MPRFRFQMWSLEFVEVKVERTATETRNRLKSASGSDVLDLTKASNAAATSVVMRHDSGQKTDNTTSSSRSGRAPSEPVAPPRKKHAAAKRLPQYRGSPLDPHLLDAVDETRGDCPFDDVKERFRDPKASVALDDGDDLMSFDDETFDDDDDDDAFVSDVTRAVTSTPSAKEPCVDSCGDVLDSQTTDARQVTSQPSDASVTSEKMTHQISDGFEAVNPSEVVREISREDEKNAALLALVGSALTGARPRRKLREGFRWQKQLVFRYKLTMHTAFERPENKNTNAAVTAVAVSK